MTLLRIVSDSVGLTVLATGVAAALWPYAAVLRLAASWAFVGLLVAAACGITFWA